MGLWSRKKGEAHLRPPWKQKTSPFAPQAEKEKSSGHAIAEAPLGKTETTWDICQRSRVFFDHAGAVLKKSFSPEQTRGDRLAERRGRGRKPISAAEESTARAVWPRWRILSLHDEAGGKFFSEKKKALTKRGE